MPETAVLAENEKKRRPLKDQTQPETPGMGHNGPTRDDYLFYVGQFKAAEKVIKEARDAKKKLRQAAKLVGLTVEVIDEVMKDAEKQDDTKLDRLTTYKQYATWHGLPIGSQISLLDHIEATKAKESVEKQAENEGYELGIMGLNTDEQKWQPHTPEGQAHLRGWQEGQKALADKFISLNEAKAAIDAEKAEKERKKAEKAKKAEEAGAEGDDGEDAENQEAA